MRKFLESPAGKVTVLVLVAIALGVLFATFRGSSSNAAYESSHRMFIDSKTLTPYEHTLVEGESVPCEAPSGAKTGYPAEGCNWTADGKISDQITYVCLNMYRNKSEPTFCPTCGRLVVGHNPLGSPGDRPPPTEAQWRQSHGGAPDASRMAR